MLILLPFLLGSRPWLANVDCVGEAIGILGTINAKMDENDPLVVAEWDDITQILEAERSVPAE